MDKSYFGKGRIENLDWLSDRWLRDGPPVCFLEGFSGVGKSDLARDFCARAEGKLGFQRAVFDEITDRQTPSVLDSLLDLAVRLSDQGLPEMEAVLLGEQRVDPGRALEQVLRRQVVIVLDEAQRFFKPDSGTPVGEWNSVLTRLRNSPNLPGRLLLLSDRIVERARWSEAFAIRTLPRLELAEALSLLDSRLASSSIGDAIPTDRKVDLVTALDHNPRAIEALVSALAFDTLDDIIGANPGLWDTTDREVSREFLTRLERDLLERTMARLDAPPRSLLLRLCVHRKSFKKEAIERAAQPGDPVISLRDVLLTRFLLGHHRGAYTLNPIVREISLARLREDTSALKTAHSLAAGYHQRHFQAKQITTGHAKLGESFAELRYHLVQADRANDLRDLDDRFTRHLTHTINWVTPIPPIGEELDERIGVLSVLLLDDGAKMFQYHLARCLERRGRPGDLKQAASHAALATGPKVPADAWLLRAQIETRTVGLNLALAGLLQGIAVLPADKNLTSLYQSCAELMARANRLDDAIALLQQGINVPGMSGLVPLYQQAIGYAGTQGNVTATRDFVVRGLVAAAGSPVRYKISETAVMVFVGRDDEASLQWLLNLTDAARLDPSQRALASYHQIRMSGDWETAALTAGELSAAFPQYTALLFCQIDANLALGRLEDAYELMRRHQNREGEQRRDSSVVWLQAYLHSLVGRIEEARSLASEYAPQEYCPECLLDEAELERLWTHARGGMNGPVERYFPGLAEYRHRVRQSALAEAGVTGQISRPRLLSIGTEWDSRHGGLSTFNRELCQALAASGADVVCLVPHATADEIERARAMRVELVVASQMVGTSDETRLCLRPHLPPGFAPDVVIGHDRITGPASAAQVKDHFPGARRVLFIHTSPEEIEWHKASRDGKSTAAVRTGERKREQLDLAKGCTVVMAVGPRLRDEFATDLHGDDNPVRVIEFTPGLPDLGVNRSSGFPPTVRCLVLGRAEDYELKGLDLAAKAMGRVSAGWTGGRTPRLVVRGAPEGTDEELRTRLQADAASAALDVVVRTYSPDAAEVRNDLREASLLLMPSRKEGFGLVGLEAIACGVPILISEHSGLAATLRAVAPECAEEWILPVDSHTLGDADVTAWAGRMKFFLRSREAAFQRATVLRTALAAHLSWQSSASRRFELRDSFGTNLPRILSEPRARLGENLATWHPNCSGTTSGPWTGLCRTAPTISSYIRPTSGWTSLSA